MGQFQNGPLYLRTLRLPGLALLPVSSLGTGLHVHVPAQKAKTSSRGQPERPSVFYSVEES